MKIWLLATVGLLVGCTAIPVGTMKEICVGKAQRVVRWQTNAIFAPALKFEQGVLQAVPTLDNVGLPRGFVFVPVCCSAIPWYENIPMVGDDGKQEGTLHVDGITRVLEPFPKAAKDGRLVYSQADRIIIGGFGDEHSDPTQPWAIFSIYLFGLPDCAKNRRALIGAKSLEELLTLCDIIVEVHTDEGKKKG